MINAMNKVPPLLRHSPAVNPRASLVGSHAANNQMPPHRLAVCSLNTKFQAATWHGLPKMHVARQTPGLELYTPALKSSFLLQFSPPSSPTYKARIWNLTVLCPVRSAYSSELLCVPSAGLSQDTCYWRGFGVGCWLIRSTLSRPSHGNHGALRLAIRAVRTDLIVSASVNLLFPFAGVEGAQRYHHPSLVPRHYSSGSIRLSRSTGRPTLLQHPG
jgi:hypothetical protein